MAKEKISYVCSACNAVFSKWAGQCGGCGAWDSLEEQQPLPLKPGRFQGYAGNLATVQTMAEVRMEDAPRFSTGLGELDRVLGGGLVPGSVVLIGGDPGVGKSTGLLQVCCNLSLVKKVLYVTGEESLQQIAMRAKRLSLPDQALLLLAETQVEDICATASQEKPSVMVIDSIQTMQVAESQSAPGSVSQVRESAAMLTQFAKKTGTAIFLVGHVTKSGDLAGPRVLEHIIDVVCYIEGGGDSRYRVMRAVKNRYGAVNELGVFAMTDKGLKEVKNPSAIFLSRGTEAMPGSVVMGDLGRAADRCSSRCRPWWMTATVKIRAGSRLVLSRTGWPCCLPCCIGTAVSPPTIRMFLSMSLAECGFLRPAPIWLCFWPCFRVLKTSLSLPTWWSLARWVLPERSGRCPAVRNDCGKR